ncbi:MAG: uracil-DNA glycosylase [Nitrospiraceae bacterium]|nr:MAG: uracil-DNA glycosylase [Nitrospiraceae bacterium]
MPINCFTCEHFYITWDEKFPRGCKAMGFKSREMPSAVVYASSGVQCLKFRKKKRSEKVKN